MKTITRSKKTAALNDIRRKTFKSMGIDVSPGPIALDSEETAVAIEGFSLDVPERTIGIREGGLGEIIANAHVQVVNNDKTGEPALVDYVLPVPKGELHDMQFFAAGSPEPVNTQVALVAA